MRSMQATFTFIVESLVSQGRPSYGQRPGASDGSEDCLYRGPDGTKCAVGWVLDDDEYSPTLEGECSDGIPLECYIEEHRPEGEIELALMEALQGAHDFSIGTCREGDWVPTFVEQATRVAKSYGLEMPELSF